MNDNFHDPSEPYDDEGAGPADPLPIRDPSRVFQPIYSRPHVPRTGGLGFVEGDPIKVRDERGFWLIPQTLDQWSACMRSWKWRIQSGQLYWITTKADDDPDGAGARTRFRPNTAQRMFLQRLWTRNLILKARQLGFSTLIEILGTDHALNIADQNVSIIAHTENDAIKLFRKVSFAYDNLPAQIRDAMPTRYRTNSSFIFAHNNSTIEASVSARGGTVHFLHISEFGKVAAKFPEKAREITTGSIQAVPQGRAGIICIESTAEGHAGQFYTMSERAKRNAEEKKKLTHQEYRFHFFPWWQEPAYTLSREDAANISMKASEHAYFDQIEGSQGIKLTLGQRAWYVAKRDTEFDAEPDMMWREYPSTPEEAWQASNEGKILAAVMAKARKERRIRPNLPVVSHVPINTFWDIGATDDTVCWVHQEIEGWHRMIRYREASGEGYLPFLLWIESLGFPLGEHFLPHDAKSSKQLVGGVTTPLAMLEEARPLWNWRVVPRVHNLQTGIDLLRLRFSLLEIDSHWCKAGIEHLDAYSRPWNNRLQAWMDGALEDGHEHAPDALRQWAQGYERAAPNPQRSQRRTRSTSGWVA